MMHEIEDCSDHVLISNLDHKIEWLQNCLRDSDKLIIKLDKAMATPERIEQDTAMVGGFASSLDLTETAEQIVDRAIVKIKDQ